MRVITGQARGRRLKAPPGVRPTAGQMKEALFSSLGARVVGARVLDLYAGSGALGIEALSRGAASAVFVDSAPASVSAIRANLAAAGMGDRAQVVRSDAVRFAARAPAGSFDLVLADPPYRSEPSAVVAAVAKAGLLAPGGLLAVETSAKQAGAVEAPAGLRLAGSRRHGDSAVVSFARAEEV